MKSHLFFLKYKTIETHARAFLTLNVLSIGTVTGFAFYFDWDFKFRQSVRASAISYLLGLVWTRAAGGV